MLPQCMNSGAIFPVVHPRVTENKFVGPLLPKAVLLAGRPSNPGGKSHQKTVQKKAPSQLWCS